MAFDLASAKPESQGFDLASATPIRELTPSTPKLSAKDALTRAYMMGGPYAGMADKDYRTLVGTGLTDPIIAVRELTGTISPEAVRQREAEYRAAAARTGQGAGFGRFMGGAITTLPLMAVPGAPASMNMLGRMAYGAGLGGTTAALMQPTTGEDDFWAQKGQQAGTGMLFGAAAPVVGAGVRKGAELLGGPGVTGAQTVDQLKKAETAAWDMVKDSTATYNATPLRDSVRGLLSPKSFNYDPDTFPALKKSVDRIEQLATDAAAGNNSSIHELRTVRTMLQNVEGSNVTQAEKALAGSIKSKLDEFMATQGGKDAKAWVKARDISNTLFRSRDVQNIVKSAEEASGATSKEIRDRFTDLLNSKAIKSYTTEQQALIKQISEGNLTEKGLELIGKMAPKSLTWKNILGLLGAETFGYGHLPSFAQVPSATLAAAVTGGAAARGTANALARQRVNLLDELIRGGKLPIAQPSTPSLIEMPYIINTLTPMSSRESNQNAFTSKGSAP